MAGWSAAGSPRRSPGAPAAGPALPGGAGGHDLTAPMRRGLRWSLASQLVVRVTTMASTVALLRLITSEDYGAFIYALAVVTVVMSVNDLGQSVAIARWPVAGVEAAARGATLVAWVGSAVWFLGCLGAAGPVAQLGGSPAAAGVTRLLAVLVLVDGVTAVPRALLLRSFRHRRVALTELLSVAANVVVSIGAAAGGAGAWAPAAGAVAAAALGGGALLATAPARPRPGWEPGPIAAALRFGTPWAVALLVELLLLNVDYLVVGGRLGPAALGLYAVAFNVASWPSTLFTQAIRRVSVSGFAQLQDQPAELAAAFTRALRSWPPSCCPCA